jgi:hypothetical protein
MLDDRRRLVPRPRPLAALAGVGEGVLGGALGDRHALHADMQPGVVHHQ